MADDTRERLVRLETQVAYLTSELADAHSKINEMHALMLRGQGAWWMMVAAAGLVGFVLSLGVKFFPWK